MEDPNHVPTIVCPSADPRRKHRTKRVRVPGSAVLEAQFVILEDAQRPVRVVQGSVNRRPVDPNRFAGGHSQPDDRMSDPAYLARFLGGYMLGSVEITVALQGNVLTLSVPGQPLYELVPDRNDEFNLKDISGFSVRFKTGGDGKIVAVLNQPNGVFELKKKE